MVYMVTFTINIPPMLAYIPYMDPMGTTIGMWLWHILPFHWSPSVFSVGTPLPRPPQLEASITSWHDPDLRWTVPNNGVPKWMVHIILKMLGKPNGIIFRNYFLDYIWGGYWGWWVLKTIWSRLGEPYSWEKYWLMWETQMS